MLSGARKINKKINESKIFEGELKRSSLSFVNLKGRGNLHATDKRRKISSEKITGLSMRKAKRQHAVKEGKEGAFVRHSSFRRMR